jgi:cell division transport system permease protein
MESNFKRILRYTRNNISRNKWLSLATILVSAIIFTTASGFIATSLIAKKAVQTAETKAQIEIYFETDAPEEEISKVKLLTEDLEGINQITYISQDDALKIYLGDNSEDADLTESISKEWLPASLEIQAINLEALEKITESVKEEEAINPYIDDVQYREDVVDQLKAISKGINIGGAVIISIFGVITFALIIITISFNIMAHKSEIEIMHLVGSKDKDISTPFVLEGIFYTTIGALIAASLILVPWYSLMHFGIDSNAYFIIKEVISELDLPYLLSFNGLFTAIFYAIHVSIAVIIGLIGSGIAVHKYLNLKKK